MHNEAPSANGAQNQANLPITVDLRLNGSAKTKAKAFADVTIALGAPGVIKILGFSVYCDNGRSVRVVPPGRKGSSKWFDVVSLIGAIQQLVHGAVEGEYNRQKSL